MLRAAFIMVGLNAGVPLRDLQIAARHSRLAPRSSTTTAARTLTCMLLTSSPPSTPAGDRTVAVRYQVPQFGTTATRLTLALPEPRGVRRPASHDRRVC